MKVIICDTHQEDLAKYETLLKNLEQQIEEDIQVITYLEPKKMLFELEDIGSQIDLIYLENELGSETDGKEVVNTIRNLQCYAEVIFLTNMKERWPDGYDVGAFHYILKSEDVKKFEEIFYKAKDKIDRKERKLMSFVYAGEKIEVEIAEIDYFESNGRIITVHYNNGKSFEFYSRMAKLENTLLPEGFVRLHRSFLANITALTEYKNGVVKARNGDLLPVSRNMQSIVRDIVS